MNQIRKKNTLKDYFEKLDGKVQKSRSNFPSVNMMITKKKE
jgi:hypothetical protein